MMGKTHFTRTIALLVVSLSATFGIANAQCNTSGGASYLTVANACSTPLYGDPNQHGPAKAIDGKTDSRWMSAFPGQPGHVDPAWIYFDLGEQYDLSCIEIDWDACSFCGKSAFQQLPVALFSARMMMHQTNDALQ